MELVILVVFGAVAGSAVGGVAGLIARVRR